MTAREIAELDPQQRLLLEVAYETLQNSGTTKWKDSTIGVYVGCFGEVSRLPPFPAVAMMSTAIHGREAILPFTNSSIQRIQKLRMLIYMVYLPGLGPYAGSRESRSGHVSRYGVRGVRHGESHFIRTWTDRPVVSTYCSPHNIDFHAQKRQAN